MRRSVREDRECARAREGERKTRILTELYARPCHHHHHHHHHHHLHHHHPHHHHDLVIGADDTRAHGVLQFLGTDVPVNLRRDLRTLLVRNTMN